MAAKTASAKKGHESGDAVESRTESSIHSWSASITLELGSRDAYATQLDVVAMMSSRCFTLLGGTRPRGAAFLTRCTYRRRVVGCEEESGGTCQDVRMARRGIPRSTCPWASLGELNDA